MQSFIYAQRQNRRRRYSLSSPNQYESRTGAVVSQLSNLKKIHSQTNVSKTNLISLKSEFRFSTTDSHKEKYDILSKLNTGAFGSTYLIRDSNDGRMYIQKRIHSQLPTIFRERLFQERRLLSFVNSNYILSLISAYIDEEHHCFTMKFEYISGVTLLHLVRQVRWFQESAAAFYCGQIVLAFEYLHESNIIYRNLKLETILLADNGYIKLVDFAFAKLLSSRSSFTYSLVGVPDIMPPEVLLARPYSFSVDWWQLGVAMFEMLTSRTPFFSPSMLQTHKNVVCNHLFPFPPRISTLARSTCRMLLQPNVNKRLGCSLGSMGAKEVKQNIWFNSHVDWTALIERTHPAPYRIKSTQIDSSQTIPMLNTIESKWLDEYDQAVRSLTSLISLEDDDTLIE